MLLGVIKMSEPLQVEAMHVPVPELGRHTCWAHKAGLQPASCLACVDA